MRALLVFIYLLLMGLSLSAQVAPVLLLAQDSSYKSRDAMVTLRGTALIGSNALDNLFLKKSFLGGHLENNHLDHLGDNMRLQNRAGFMMTSGIEFLNFRDTLFKKPDLGLRVDVNTNYHGGMSFQRNLYKLIYRGNAPYAGDTLDIGPLAMQYQAWQKFGVGIFNKHTLSSITFSLVEGQSYESLIVTDAGLYTSEFGDSLALSYAGEYMRSDTSRKGWANGSGLGAAFDLEYNLPLNDRKGVISVSVRDLGFVVWNKQSEAMTFDSLTTWTGIDVENLFDFASDSIEFPNLGDSLYKKSQRRSFIAPLPATITLRYSRFFNDRDCIDAGVTMWPNRAAVPMLFAGASHFVGQRFVVSERVCIGGYARFGIGAEVQWMPRGSWLLRLGTNSLGGLTMGSAHGRDLYFALGKSF